MRTLVRIPLIALALVGCSRQNAAEAIPDETNAPAPAAGERELAWDLQSSGEGVALALLSGERTTVVRLFCPASGNRLLVNVPAFEPIGSEERLSFGSGDNATTLVADSRGDPQRGGVTGSGAVPADLPALIGGPVSVSYGAQASGPHPAPPGNLARDFVAACSEERSEPAAPRPQPAGACLTQDGRPVPANRLRAIGTEPFWGARIEGRCVTYSHPEDQQGTRVWTRFTRTREGGRWSGALGNRRFELATRREPGCSDGMSDRRYPIAVDLLVGGERRQGCAEPR